MSTCMAITLSIDNPEHSVRSPACNAMRAQSSPTHGMAVALWAKARQAGPGASLGAALRSKASTTNAAA